VDVGRTLDQAPARWWTSFALSTLREVRFYPSSLQNGERPAHTWSRD